MPDRESLPMIQSTRLRGEPPTSRAAGFKAPLTSVGAVAPHGLKPAAHWDPAAFRKRRAALYVLVIGAAMLVMVIGISAVTVARVRTDAAAASANEQTARLLAASAIDYGMSRIDAAAEAGTNWRDGRQSGVPTAPQTLGSGVFRCVFLDEQDADLNDNAVDLVRLYGAGMVGGATQVVSVQLVPGGPGLDVLRTVIHSADGVVVAKDVYAAGGPVSANAGIELTGKATLYGDAEAGSITLTDGVITGSSTAPAPTKSMPSAEILEKVYLPRATEITWASTAAGDLSAPLLSAGTNPWGAANQFGLYHVRVPDGQQLQVLISRIEATLLVTLGNGSSFGINASCFWQPALAEYPALIVDGRLGTSATLQPLPGAVRESDVAANLNPASTPFNGQSDTDTTDQYPSEIRGLIHIIGTGMVITVSGAFYGSIVSDGLVNVADVTSIRVDPGLIENPPLGYGDGSRMIPVAGTWRRDTMP
jgi:hypothetical protein